MNKKSNKTLLVGIILIAITIGMCGYLVVENMWYRVNLAKAETQRLAFYREYSEVSQDNLFQYASIEEVLTLVKSGTGVIYFGFPSCPWCQVYVPVLDEVSREQGLDKVLYYNPKEIRSENTAEYKELVAILGDYLDSDKDGNKRLYVPHVFAIKEGKVVGENNDMSTMSGDAKAYFTEDRRKELKTKLMDIISSYKESCNDTIGEKGC